MWKNWNQVVVVGILGEKKKKLLLPPPTGFNMSTPIWKPFDKRSPTALVPVERDFVTLNNDGGPS